MSSKKRKDREQKSRDLQGFIDEFLKEGDRATAILGAALLDENLFQLLSRFLVDDKKQVDLLLDTEQPIGSFGARIRLAYCLGLITLNTFKALMIIKGIRNAFAHQLHGLSFSDPDIVKEVDKLRSLQPQHDFMKWNGRAEYLCSTLSAQMDLSSSTMSVDARQRRCKVPEWKTLVAWKRGETT